MCTLCVIPLLDPLHICPGPVTLPLQYRSVYLRFVGNLRWGQYLGPQGDQTLLSHSELFPASISDYG